MQDSICTATMAAREPQWDSGRSATILRVLSHPTRLEIMRVASAGEVSVGALAARLDLPQPTTSQHLRILREHEILTVRGDGNRRLYRINPTPLQELRHLLDGIWPTDLARLKDVAERNHADDRTGV